MLKRHFISVFYGLLVGFVLVGCKAQTIQPTPAIVTKSFSSLTPLTTDTSAPTLTVAGVYTETGLPAETILPPSITPTLAAYTNPTESLPAYPEPAGYTPQAYPEPTEAEQAAYPAPTESPVAAYPNPTQPPAAYPGPTQPSLPASTALPNTATPNQVPATATPASSPVPTNTPLPTPTSIPMATPTPELPPPIRPELSASDPSEFELVSGEIQLVEFFAYWCVACRSQADEIHQLEALYGSRMIFVYLDIDDPANEKFEQALGFRYEPDFFLLDPQGKILQEWSGWINPDEMRNAIEGALRMY